MTAHFSLAECESHRLCTKHGFPIVKNRIPRVATVANPISSVAEWMIGCELLETARAQLGSPITISCGYRCPELNRLAGGAPNSQHLGYSVRNRQVIQSIALDLQTATEAELDRLYAILQTLPHDQLIMEDRRQGRDWIHWSYNLYAPNRSQAFTLNV